MPITFNREDGGVAFNFYRVNPVAAIDRLCPWDTTTTTVDEDPIVVDGSPLNEKYDNGCLDCGMIGSIRWPIKGP